MKSYWFSNDSLLPHIKELWYQIRAAFQILWKIIWLQIMAATLYHIIYPDVMCCRNLPNNENMKILFLMLDFLKRNCQREWLQLQSSLSTSLRLGKFKCVCPFLKIQASSCLNLVWAWSTYQISCEPLEIWKLITIQVRTCQCSMWMELT